MRIKNIFPKNYSKISVFFYNMSWPFRQFFRGVKNFYDYRKIIWQDRDFDDGWLVDIIRFKLVRMKKFWEQVDYVSQDSHAHFCIQRINTLIKMLDDIIIDEKYAMEYMSHIEKIYGEEEHYFPPSETHPNCYEWKSRFKKEYSERELQEIEKLRTRLMLQGRKKQKRAEDLFWRFFGHSLPYLWD